MATIGPGELFLQQRLLGENSVVMDVGAGTGAWTESALRTRPGLVSHLFESSSQAFSALARTLGPAIAQGRARCNEVVVGEGSGNHAGPASTTTIDAYCASAGLRRFDFLKLDVGGRTLSVLRGARRLLSRRLIDYIQLTYGPAYQETGSRLEQVFDDLTRHGYLMLRLLPGRLDHHPGFLPALEDYKTATYLAVSPRLRGFFLGGTPRRFDHPKLFRAHGIVPRGLVHVGARDGQALAGYQAAGCGQFVFVEGDPASFARLQERHAGSAGVRCLQGVVGSPGATLDDLLERNEIDAANVLAIEAGENVPAVLEGARRTLATMDAVLVEAHYRQPPAGGALIDELDAFLEPLGLRRVEEISPDDPRRGDTLYVRHPLVTMTSLGINGRFANQLFQYYFLTLAAERLGGLVQTPAWVGEQLFAIQNPRPEGRYYVVYQTPTDTDPQRFLGDLRPGESVDLWGYFQYHARHLAPQRDRFRRLFTPRPELRQPLDAALERLRGDRRTMVALHLRRGDYGKGGAFFVTPSAWYLQALEELWPHLDAPWLYLASDETDKVMPDFAAYAPVTTRDLQLEMKDAAFYPDFYALTQADVLVISNSTFSFAASLLAERASIFLRPDPDLARLIPFSPWSSEVLLQRDAYCREARVVERLLAAGRRDEAQTRLEAYVTRHPDLAEAHNDLAVVRHLGRDLSGALAAADRALALCPRDPTAHRNRAAIAQELAQS